MKKGAYKELKERGCQFCGKKRDLDIYIPAGVMCRDCKKNLDLIRKYKTGIPKPKILCPEISTDEQGNPIYKVKELGIKKIKWEARENEF